MRKIMQIWPVKLQSVSGTVTLTHDGWNSPLRSSVTEFMTVAKDARTLRQMRRSVEGGIQGCLMSVSDARDHSTMMVVLSILSHQTAEHANCRISELDK